MENKLSFRVEPGWALVAPEMNGDPKSVAISLINAFEGSASKIACCHCMVEVCWPPSSIGREGSRRTVSLRKVPAVEGNRHHRRDTASTVVLDSDKTPSPFNLRCIHAVVVLFRRIRSERRQEQQYGEQADGSTHISDSQRRIKLAP
jgi:hypothetical protein